MTLTDPAHFFGYGSLVNRATHDYPGARPARLAGWRRIWCHTPARDLAFLSVRPAEGAEIAGLVAEVPGRDWAALDTREAAYTRHAVQAISLMGVPIQAQVYAVPGGGSTSDRHGILLSYLDAVLQGFLREFAEIGVAEFFATTDGWEARIIDDRAAPLYPRAQVLTSRERGIVDTHLAAQGCTIRPGS
ncbi:MAG: gamma-glutamylcyclotransferase family protein [Pseudorhodobacter sp.]